MDWKVQLESRSERWASDGEVQLESERERRDLSGKCSWKAGGSRLENTAGKPEETQGTDRRVQLESQRELTGKYTQLEIRSERWRERDEEVQLETLRYPETYIWKSGVKAGDGLESTAGKPE